MRPLNDYALSDWAVGEPLVHGFRRARNVAFDRLFRARRPAGLDRFLADHASLRGSTMVLSIAYNTPRLIELLTRITARNLVADAHIIADNSRDPRARAEIERICRERAVPYIGLPPNPERHPCRSHGIALNWAYYNVVLPLRPKVFGFIDHDLIPLDRLDVAGLVAAQPFYGRLKRVRITWGWYLWPGYCFYDFSAVEQRALDFNHDRARHFDTGGRNWIALYRHHDRSKLRFAKFGKIKFTDPVKGDRHIVRVCDRAVHLGGGGRLKRQGNPEIEFALRLIKRCEDGMTFDELKPPEK